MKRPFAVIGSTYIAAQAVAVFFGLGISMAVFALTAVAAVIYFFISKKRSAAVIVVLACVLAANAVYCVYDLRYISPTERLEGTSAYISGTITQDPYENNGRYYYVVKSSTNIGRELRSGCVVRISSKTRLDARVSDDISALVTFDRSASSVSFASRTSLLAKGITVTAHIYSDSSVAVLKNDGGIKRTLSNARKAVKTAADRTLNTECGALLCAVLLGDTSGLESTRIRDFRVCGLSHLLAVSGMHLSILTLALTMALRYFKIARKQIDAISIAFVVVFMAIVGFSSSVMRAGAMMILMLVADILERENDSLNSLGFAVFFICILSPTAAADCGLILSATSTLGIILLHPMIASKLAQPIKSMKTRKGKFQYKCVQMLSLNISATLFTLPFTMLWFGSVSLISPIANLVCIAPATWFLIIGAVASLLYMLPIVGVYLAYVPSIVAWFLGKLLLLETKLLAAIPNAGISVNYDFLPVFFVGTLVMVILTICLFRNIKAKRFAAALLCMAFCLQALLCGIAINKLQNIGKSTVTVYSVEDGLCTALTSKGRTVLVGAGGDSYMNWLATLDLEDNNIMNVDALLLPALDRYAAGSAEDAIERFRPEYLFTPEKGKYDYPVFTAAKKNGSAIYSIDNCSYVDADNDIMLKSFTDEQGYIWVYAVVGELSVLICPPQGDCLKIPEEWRVADVVIMSDGKQTNAAYISASAFVISADEKTGAEAKLLLEYRGIENVFTTGENGGLLISSKNGKIIIGGVEYAGY